MTKALLVGLALATVLILLVIAALVRMRAGRGRSRSAVRGKPLLTTREQPMFFRLQQAFPNDIVLAQVAFSALLTAKDLATRATYNRKVADFVVVNKAFQVLAVIELDDSSHRGREADDRQRDALLSSAGYRVLRYKTVPDVVVLQHALALPVLDADRPASEPVHAKAPITG